MARSKLHIDSAAKLSLLQDDVRPGLGRRYRSLTFALPGLSEAENAAVKKRVDRHYRACGCAEGALLGFAALIGYGAWAITRAEPLGWSDLLWAGAAFFVATTVGKLVGLHRAHAKLRAEVDSLVDLHGKKEEPEEEEVLCAVS